ncbi:ATP synthase subunit H-domain-containing protein [Epithele typhae]|uniref:ATP synthase subunit H-domain-containing protein n=1 Tax=Epithele typhae TaxID=378194 RepID=UPI002008AE3E|nr:ATP synthase subunit H-domain-containing protein [Epithele typhae]KAH9945358.1 ATP synthase subunit H-domain-containing protein [Epithele typhae]
MSTSLPTLFVLVVVLGLMSAAWFSTPKGPNQTLIRTSLMLTLACCYLMWSVTYLAQVHPLESPLPPAPAYLFPNAYWHRCSVRSGWSILNYSANGSRLWMKERYWMTDPEVAYFLFPRKSARTKVPQCSLKIRLFAPEFEILVRKMLS